MIERYLFTKSLYRLSQIWEIASTACGIKHFCPSSLFLDISWNTENAVSDQFISGSLRDCNFYWITQYIGYQDPWSGAESKDWGFFFLVHIFEQTLNTTKRDIIVEKEGSSHWILHLSHRGCSPLFVKLRQFGFCPLSVLPLRVCVSPSEDLTVEQYCGLWSHAIHAKLQSPLALGRKLGWTVHHALFCWCRFAWNYRQQMVTRVGRKLTSKGCKEIRIESNYTPLVTRLKLPIQTKSKARQRVCTCDCCLRMIRSHRFCCALETKRFTLP